MAWLLIVMPRSRSRSISSSTCACKSFPTTVPVVSSKRSASVLLPWSICAIIQKFLMFFIYEILDLSCKNMDKAENFKRKGTVCLIIHSEIPERDYIGISTFDVIFYNISFWETFYLFLSFVFPSYFKCSFSYLKI